YMSDETFMAPDGHADLIDTQYEIGQDNVQPHIGPFDFDIHNPVFVVSGLTVVAIVAITLLFPAQAGAFLEWLRPALTSTFDWFFLLAGDIFVMVALGIMLSPLGKVRIGGTEATPDYSYTGWFSMLFAAGMGIGLMFYGVGEPISHFSTSLAENAGAPDSWAPLGGAAGNALGAERLGMAATIYHWSLHPWAVYAIVGL